MLKYYTSLLCLIINPKMRFLRCCFQSSDICQRSCCQQCSNQGVIFTAEKKKSHCVLNYVIKVESQGKKLCHMHCTPGILGQTPSASSLNQHLVHPSRR
uniref:Uncharacterized protein n=1 Tax=Monopterus albus TaxID=43700 RepID=A0A3Q3K5V7_MONAL